MMENGREPAVRHADPRRRQAVWAHRRRGTVGGRVRQAGRHTVQSAPVTSTARHSAVKWRFTTLAGSAPVRVP